MARIKISKLQRQLKRRDRLVGWELDDIIYHLETLKKCKVLLRSYHCGNALSQGAFEDKAYRVLKRLNGES